MTGSPSEPTLDEALQGASGRLLATPAILLVLLAAFGASVRWGDLSLWDPTAWQLFRCGGAFGPAAEARHLGIDLADMDAPAEQGFDVTRFARKLLGLFHVVADAGEAGEVFLDVV